MRVAIVGPDKPIGGISSHVRELSKGLRRKGSEVFFVPKSEKGRIASASYYLSSLLKEFDVIHVQGLQQFQPLLAALSARRMLGTRTVATAHGFGGESGWWYSTVQRDTMRAVLRDFDKLISISSYVQERLHRFTGLGLTEIVNIYNGVDTATFSPQVDSTQFKNKVGLDGFFVVLYVGRLAWNKGIPDLISGVGLAADRIPNMRLVICGRGRLEAELKQQVSTMGLGNIVRFAGIVPGSDLPLYYSLCDVVAAPSIFEPFGLVPLEAMSAGRPVIATTVGGIPELVKDGENGILVPPKSPHSIADALLTLRTDEDLRAQLGRSGRKMVEQKFTLERMADATWECYKSLVEN